jgi:hypothetical protein
MGLFYLVNFVVVLRIVLEDLGLFDICEVLDNIVDLELLSPLFTIGKPLTTSAIY